MITFLTDETNSVKILQFYRIILSLLLLEVGKYLRLSLFVLTERVRKNYISVKICARLIERIQRGPVTVYLCPVVEFE